MRTALPTSLTSLLLGCGVRGPPCVRMGIPSDNNRIFKLRIDLGDGKAGNLKFKPLLPDSDAVIVKYPVPFGLNVEQDARGLAVCTKSGTGGERPGDILRYSTAYNMGLPEDDGLVGSVSRHGSRGRAHPPRRARHVSCDPCGLPLRSISGSLSWQVYLFDVGK